MSESLYRKASLVMNPYGALDGELPSIKPTDGSGDFTFSRDGAGASPATRVNASGLIEKGRENILLQSNSFDTTWTNASTTETGGQAGYDGTNDAWLLSKSAGFARIAQPISVSGVHTASVYVKAGTLSWCRFLMVPVAAGTDPQVYINLADGSLGSEYNNITATSTSVGGGWYRLTLTFQQAITEFRIYPAEGNNNVGGTSGNIYIQDAQLESGLVATDYIETTTAPVSAGLLGDMPRLDYSGGATCPSLLLEPSRVNSFTQSEYFSALMTLDAGITIDVNAETSPEGVQNAARLNFNVASKSMYRAVSFAGEHAYSFYVKAEGSNIGKTFNFRLRDTSNVAVNHAVPLTGEWVRHDFQFSDANLMEFTNREGTTIDTGGFLLWGIQVESGSYPTSYIPTYGSASTRGEDDCWLLNSGSMPTDYPVTLFVEAPIQTGKDEDFISFGRSDVSDSYKAIQFQDTSNKVQVQNRVGASNTILESSSTYTTGTLKIAYKLTATEVKVFVNGVEEVSSTSVQAFDSVDDLLLGQLRIISDTNRRSTLKQALVFPIALTDAECIALTQI